MDRPVLVLESSLSIQRELSSLLRLWGYEPVVAASLDEATVALVRNRFLFTIVDGDFESMNGSQLLSELKAHGDPGSVIVLSSGRDGSVVVTKGLLDADDFVRKPLVSEELESAIKNLRPSWEEVPAGQPDDPWSRLMPEVGLWRSPKMRVVWDIVQQAAQVDVTVLVCGETGTGKDLIARSIHLLSARHDRPFVKVNCAAVPRELLESELFGHERGSFTGAHKLRIGKFESANHGTVFLDEIGDLHPALQAKLLHVLQDGAFSRVGGKSTIKVDVRVLAATNQDLERAVAEGRFREDLYYRLNVIQIVVPPLRERAEEIPILTDYFIRRYARIFKREEFKPHAIALERLQRHQYPGNVRELENIVKRMIVLSDPLLVRASLPTPEDTKSLGPRASEAPTARSLKDIAREAARGAEREAIARVLEQTGWNRVRAAKLLRISYRALLYKMKDTGLQRKHSPATLDV